jgi:hypothetical protein
MKYCIKVSLLIVLLSQSNFFYACTIFTSSSIKAVFAGNNEDMCTTNTIVHLIPPSQNEYGRILWGFKGDENYQGGMNQYGLFFDGASTPEVEMTNSNLPEFGEKYIFEVVLEKCKTVSEAIEFISQYSLPYLKFCHILIADASGDAAIVEWGGNKLNIIRKGESNYLVATNFNITETTNATEECFRYSTAENMLHNTDPTIKLFENILSLTHVEGKFPTVYSNICDLKNKKVYLYNFHNYCYCKEINLKEELKKGEKQYMIRSFFPVSTSETIFRIMNDCSDSFDNNPTCQVTFKIKLNKPFIGDKLFIQGSAKELGGWNKPGIELEKLNNNVFEKTFSIQQGKLFDFTIAALNDKYFFYDTNLELIKESVIEVKSDTLVEMGVHDWKLKE